MATTARKNVQVDASALMGHLHDFALVMGKTIGEVVRDQAALFCQDMISYSRPFSGRSPGSGATKGAKDDGDNNVKQSIRKIFRPVELATKEQIAAVGKYEVFKLWTKRKGERVQGKGKAVRWQQFQEKFGGGSAMAFVDSGDLATMGRIHRSLRNDNGHGSLTSAARNSKQPFAIVAKDRDIERYIRNEQKVVGTLKSAYYFAGVRIRGKIKAPAWAKQAGGQENTIADDKTAQPKKPEVTVGNLIGGKAGNDKFVKLAISHRAYAMRVKMAAELNKKKIPLWAASARGQTTNTAKYF
jgi:hypothetical protein